MSLLRKLNWQFSVKTALLLLCLSGCYFAYVAEVKRRQVDVLKIVRELGGQIWNVDFSDGRAIKPSRSAVLPDYLYLFLPERYNYIYVTCPEVNDDLLAKILKLPGIEGLNISSSTITDKGLQMLKEKSGLREIQLYNIPTVSDEAVLELKASACCRIQF
jgi:hypothetical protein